MRTPRLILAACAGALVSLAAPAALAADQSVRATNEDLFRPSKVAVKPGEKVTFTNAPNNGEHNVVWTDGKVPPMPAEAVDGSQWPAGGVSRTFDASGKYRFYCVTHGDKDNDFGMFGYVYVNPAGALPPTVKSLKASSPSKTKVTLKFKASAAGKAKATFLRKSSGKFKRTGSTASFSVKAGSVSHKVTRAFAKGSWRVEVVLTDANKLKSDKATKSFTVS